jgi:hypothetical protein
MDECHQECHQCDHSILEGHGGGRARGNRRATPVPPSRLGGNAGTSSHPWVWILEAYLPRPPATALRQDGCQHDTERDAMWAGRRKWQPALTIRIVTPREALARCVGPVRPRCCRMRRTRDGIHHRRR